MIFFKSRFDSGPSCEGRGRVEDEEGAAVEEEEEEEEEEGDREVVMMGAEIFILLLLELVLVGVCDWLCGDRLIAEKIAFELCLSPL